jgi:hypothetical protein
MQTRDNHSIAINPKPQTVRKLFQIRPSHVLDDGCVAFWIFTNSVDCFQNAIKELVAQPFGLRFVPACRCLYVGASCFCEADVQRVDGCLRVRRIPAIASRASTAVFRSSSNVARRCSTTCFSRSEISGFSSGRIAVLLILYDDHKICALSSPRRPSRNRVPKMCRSHALLPPFSACMTRQGTPAVLTGTGGRRGL